MHDLKLTFICKLSGEMFAANVVKFSQLLYVCNRGLTAKQKNGFGFYKIFPLASTSDGKLQPQPACNISLLHTEICFAFGRIIVFKYKNVHTAIEEMVDSAACMPRAILRQQSFLLPSTITVFLGHL